MKVQSTAEAQRFYNQAFGIANFIVAGVLFGAGFVLTLISSDPFMAHDAALIFMTAGAIGICFAAAFSAGEVPAAEKTRLRALSIMGTIVVVIAATLITSHFRVGTFEIITMLVGLGGAPGMYWLGETVRAKTRVLAGMASKSEAKPQAEPAKPTESAQTTTASEDTSGGA